MGSEMCIRDSLIKYQVALDDAEREFLRCNPIPVPDHGGRVNIDFLRSEFPATRPPARTENNVPHGLTEGHVVEGNGKHNADVAVDKEVAAAAGVTAEVVEGKGNFLKLIFKLYK